jgi:hypothetical protein
VAWRQIRCSRARTERPQCRQHDLAGLLNTYYWIDRQKRVAAVFMT